jgi:hypothetical protein
LGDQALLANQLCALLAPIVQRIPETQPRVLASQVTINTVTIRTQVREKQAACLNSIPLDVREHGESVMEKHLSRSLARDRLEGFRHPLLCNIGVAGSGKTIQLALNAAQFLQRFHNGFAVGITFNDDALTLKLDQWGVFKTDSNDMPLEDPPMGNFSRTVAQAILLRLVEFCCGTHYSTMERDGVFVQEMTECMQLVLQLEMSPLKALALVRTVLGMTPNAPVLLMVDELAKLNNPRRCLTLLCEIMDSEKAINSTPRKFYLTASTFGCMELINFATGSNRAIDLQPLPPLFPLSLSRSDTDLPAILQLLKSPQPSSPKSQLSESQIRDKSKHQKGRRERRRAKKANGVSIISPKDPALQAPAEVQKRKETKSVFSYLSQLILFAGGHPRRLALLLDSLQTFTSILGVQPEGIPLVDTVNNVQAMLNNDQERAGLLAALDPSSEFPNWYSDIVEQMEQVSDPMIGFYEHQSKFDEAVQRHLVVPFAFPTNNDERLLLSSTLFMLIQAGKCSFLPQRESTKGLLYVPYLIPS